MVAKDATLAELASVVRRLPQTTVNVRVDDRDRVATSPAVAAAVARADEDLGDSGRVLLRPSGTEPVVRVMVEAATQEQADAVAHQLAGIVAAV
jgi:phosphoglucosamine mutase